MHRFENSPGSIVFTLGGVPTIIRPTAWLVLLLLGSASGKTAQLDLVPALTFVAAGMLCLLVHEYGHAFTCRALGGGDSVVEISSLGGVTISSYPPRTRLGHILMILAGPGASLALGVLGGLALGISIGNPLAGLICSVYDPLIGILPITQGIIELCYPPIIEALNTGELAEFTWRCYSTLFLVCVWWSLLNMLPIFPLDGGKTLYLITRRADWTSKIGVATAGILLLWCLLNAMMFNALICGYLLYVNWQYMKTNRS